MNRLKSDHERSILDNSTHDCIFENANAHDVHDVRREAMQQSITAQHKSQRKTLDSHASGRNSPTALESPNFNTTQCSRMKSQHCNQTLVTSRFISTMQRIMKNNSCNTLVTTRLQSASKSDVRCAIWAEIASHTAATSTQMLECNLYSLHIIIRCNAE